MVVLDQQRYHTAEDVCVKAWGNTLTDSNAHRHQNAMPFDPPDEAKHFGAGLIRWAKEINEDCNEKLWNARLSCGLNATVSFVETMEMFKAIQLFQEEVNFKYSQTTVASQHRFQDGEMLGTPRVRVHIERLTRERGRDWTNIVALMRDDEGNSYRWKTNLSNSTKHNLQESTKRVIEHAKVKNTVDDHGSLITELGYVFFVDSPEKTKKSNRKFASQSKHGNNNSSNAQQRRQQRQQLERNQPMNVDQQVNQAGATMSGRPVQTPIEEPRTETPLVETPQERFQTPQEYLAVIEEWEKGGKEVTIVGPNQDREWVNLSYWSRRMGTSSETVKQAIVNGISRDQAQWEREGMDYTLIRILGHPKVVVDDSRVRELEIEKDIVKDSLPAFPDSEPGYDERFSMLEFD